jgi:hypothetical protein
VTKTEKELFLNYHDVISALQSAKF